MPNGGSDCCGTCPFNRKNRGQAGYGGRDNPEPHYCEIRSLSIEDQPFWTYCANHPHHNPDGIRIPIGPVYVADDGFPYGRKVLVPSPDTEAIRVEILRLISSATPDPLVDYPAGLALVEAAILQAGEFRDRCYILELERIRQFPAATADGEAGFARDPARCALLATEALRRIIQPESVRPFTTTTVKGIAEGIAESGDISILPILADALQDAGCDSDDILAHCRGEEPHVRGCWVVDLVLGKE